MALRIVSQLLIRKGSLWRSAESHLVFTWNKPKQYSCLSPLRERGRNPISLSYLKRLPFLHLRWQKTLSSSMLSHAPSVKQIEQLLVSKELEFEHGHTSILASCPFCARGTGKDKIAKSLSLYVNKTTGSHVCKHCKSAGSWEQFKVITFNWFYSY